MVGSCPRASALAAAVWSPVAVAMLLSAAGRPAASAAAAGAPCGPPASGIRPSPANTENRVSLHPLWERGPSGRQEAAWGTMIPAPSPPWSSTELVPKPLQTGSLATAPHAPPAASLPKLGIEERHSSCYTMILASGSSKLGEQAPAHRPSLPTGPGDLTLHEPVSPSG